MIVSNATPLIYLAKIGRLELLKKLYKEVVISNDVKKEVVDEGKRLCKNDSLIIENAIKSGWIKIEKIVATVKTPIQLEKGELSTLALAKQKNATEVLIDEISARTVANLLGITPRGTVFVLLKSIKIGQLSFDEFLECMKQLAIEGFYLSEEVYMKAVEEARKIARQ